VLFNCEDSKQSCNFENTINILANHVRAKYEFGSEISIMIKKLKPVIFAQPEDLSSNLLPTATQEKIWESTISAY
jgi:hypothetical protein